MKLSNKELKRLDDVLDDLSLMSHLAFVYGVDEVYSDLKSRKDEIQLALDRRDKMLLVSAVKLAHRALAAQSKILLFYLARDVRDAALVGRPLNDILVTAVSFVVDFMRMPINTKKTHERSDYRASR